MAKNSDKRLNSLKSQAIGLVVGLVVQYILGMTTNLFVKFPDSGNPGQYWEFAWRQVPTALHILVGFSLLIGAVALFVRATIYKDKNWRVSSGIALGAILLAIVAGSQFIPSQNDLYSLAMSLFFLAALLSLGWGLYCEARDHRAHSSRK